MLSFNLLISTLIYVFFFMKGKWDRVMSNINYNPDSCCVKRTEQDVILNPV